MNRFRTRKRAKDESSTRRPYENVDIGLSFFGRRKKAPSEEKPALDIKDALPSTDDFRTSLLMNGLSARFSMLREQDDPNTKIGKASDDSVLYPKRQSRLADLGGFGLGLGGLADIAEVESIKGSYARMNSYASASDDADSTKAGSIMNRPKPNEGNNLFGGRQKIYKITAGAKSTTSGMGGRALYEDDVPMSSFQRWRQQERQRCAPEDALEPDQTAMNEPMPESPQVGYNRRRETSSTTSSAQRNSTAATSVVSGPTQPNVAKELPPPPSSTGSTSSLERAVMRTRRLYEQGLNQEMQEQQSSALSRIDTIARRGLGSRTPDLSTKSSSPTTNTFNDRLGVRRNILTKTSAPNLRSFSPPASASSISTIDTGARPGRSPVAEAKAAFGSEPPLSPPISDGSSGLPIIPNQAGDRGKATVLGVHHKPSHNYEESAHAQRQVQLLQGRESPSNRFRPDSTAPFRTARSRSNSSTRRERLAEKPKPLEKTKEESQDEPKTEVHDSDVSPLSPLIAKPLLPSGFERPSDSDHPAFRQSAVPNPLTVTARDMQKSPTRPNLLPQPNASDSSTFGSTSPPGLGGLVRSHLRNDSNASSLYGGEPSTSRLEARFPKDPYEGTGLAKDLEGGSVKTGSSPWDTRDSQFGSSTCGIDDLASANKKSPELMDTVAESKSEEDDEDDEEEKPTETSITHHSLSDMEKMEEQNEFARELAEGARRVRERLTSYVESDSSRAASPHESPRDLQISRSPGLGLLKPKSSRGSLVDKNRGDSNVKPIKVLGLGGAPTTTAPASGRQSSDEATPLATMKEEPGKEQDTTTPGLQEGRPQGTPAIQGPSSQDTSCKGLESACIEEPGEKPTMEPAQDQSPEEPKIHVGVKAFRQARREMQRLKEIEMQARHQAPTTQELIVSPTTAGEYSQRQRTPSRERQPPPVFYHNYPSNNEYQSMNVTAEPDSKLSIEHRGRSGSEANNGVTHTGRSPRIRSASVRQEEHQLFRPNHPGPSPVLSPMLHSAGLPATDGRRPPYMPPHATGYFVPPSQSNGNAGLQPLARMEASHPLPTSPMGLHGMQNSPFSISPGVAALNGVGIQRTRGPSVPTISTLEKSAVISGPKPELVKRSVNKAEISDPKFVSATSRVHPVNISEGSRSRSQSGSRSHPNSNAAQAKYVPALPPINPRRRTDNTKTTAMDPINGRNNGDENIGTLGLALQGQAPQDVEENRSAFSLSEDEEGKPDRKLLRKVVSETNGVNSRSRSRGNSPPYSKAPPVSRTVFSPSRSPRTTNAMAANGMGMGVPGGMI